LETGSFGGTRRIRQGDNGQEMERNATVKTKTTTTITKTTTT
jgi:hypothetical protein